nr:Protein arginine N-methyltransferase 5 [Euglena gracilis]
MAAAPEDHVYVGLDIEEGEEAVDLDEGLATCTGNDLDFLCLPLCGPEFEPFRASAKILTTSDWHHAVVGKVSGSLNFDEEDTDACHAAEELLLREVGYCSHLALPAVLLPRIGHASIAHYGRAVYSCLLQHPYPMLWLRVPLSLDGEDEDADGAWLAWNALRTMCGHHPKLVPALELTADLPAPHVLDRWRAEQVKCLIIDTSIFISDPQGRPVLSHAHQAFVQQCLRYKAQVVLSGAPGGSEPAYQRYRGHLVALRKAMPKLTAIQEYEQPFFDCLQAPLQPLMDHLEAQTYEVFERDPVKYQQYEKAIALALKDIPREEGSAVVVMVVGAGRGPLVNCTLRASKQTKVPVRVYAVEKNPNAVVTLQAMKRQCDWGAVTLVSADMRHWEAPEGCDLLVSELLGSFGDNELSPECLDGAQRFLKPDGISIPCSSTSYLAPVMSAKLWNEVAVRKDPGAFETSYVVRIHAGVTIAEPQACFTFEHPNPEHPVFFGAPPCNAPLPDNTRSRTLRFVATRNAMIHGFAGYFEAQLYGDVTLSILPATHTTDMFSWFPILFPVKAPFTVRQGDAVEVAMWRRATPQKVWYEWLAVRPSCGTIHNPNGRACSIGV